MSLSYVCVMSIITDSTRRNIIPSRTCITLIVQQCMLNMEQCMLNMAIWSSVCSSHRRICSFSAKYAREMLFFNYAFLTLQKADYAKRNASIMGLSLGQTKNVSGWWLEFLVSSSLSGRWAAVSRSQKTIWPSWLRWNFKSIILCRHPYPSEELGLRGHTSIYASCAATANYCCCCYDAGSFYSYKGFFIFFIERHGAKLSHVPLPFFLTQEKTFFLAQENADVCFAKGFGISTGDADLHRRCGGRSAENVQQLRPSADH